ncbi:hypothetical protein D3C72_1267230 [compost metagenome]
MIFIIHTYWALTFDKGVITGVAYISSCTAKTIRKLRSRYLFVSALMIRPRPRPIPAIIRISKGSRTIIPLGVSCSGAVMR